MADKVELIVGDEVLTFGAVDAPSSTDGEMVPTSNTSDTLRRTLSEAMDPLRVFAQGVGEKISGFEPKPDEVEVKVGFSVTTKAGIIFAEAGAEGQMEMTLKWKVGSSDG